MKFSRLILIGCSMLLLSVQAKASIVWELNNFSFGAQEVTGQFEWDEATNTILDWNITTGPHSTSPGVYNTATSIASTVLSDPRIGIRFSDIGSSWDFRIGLSNVDLLDTPVSSLLLTGAHVGHFGANGYLECNNCGDIRWGDAGAFLSSVSAVPEPSTYALMLGGLGLVGFMAARRRKQA